MTLGVYGSRGQSRSTPPRHHILLVTRTEALAHGVFEVLARVPDFHVSVVGDPAAAARRLTTGGIDAVVLDLRGDEVHALMVVQQSLRRVPLVPIVVLAAAHHVDQLTQVLRFGATDVLLDGEFDDARLELALRHALECRHQHEQLARGRCDAPVEPASRRPSDPVRSAEPARDPWCAIQALARLAIARLDHAIDAETKLRRLLHPPRRGPPEHDTLADEVLEGLGRDLDAARHDALELAEMAARRSMTPS